MAVDDLANGLMAMQDSETRIQIGNGDFTALPDVWSTDQEVSCCEPWPKTNPKSLALASTARRTAALSHTRARTMPACPRPPRCALVSTFRRTSERWDSTSLYRDP